MAAAQCSKNSTGNSTKKGAVSQSIEWLSANDGFAKAAKEKKIIIMDVYTDWCGWCKKMDEEVYSTMEISSIISNKFVAVKFNPEKDNDIKYKDTIYSGQDFMRKILEVDGFPSIVFFSSTGDFISKTSGYIPAEAFAQMLNDIGGGEPSK